MKMLPELGNLERTVPHIPPYGRFLLRALSFSAADSANPVNLIQRDWQSMLDLCDRLQLTLLLGRLAEKKLPEWAQQRIGEDYRNNTIRFKRLVSQTEEICKSLETENIAVAVLKGVTHWSSFIPDPVLRSQGDIDLWCQPRDVTRARAALEHLGYHPVIRSKGRHLDPMIRETSWNWTGDYYAPDLPIPVDLHYQLWDDDMERIPGLNEDQVWTRRIGTHLDRLDAFAFACLHVMMHLLHGDLRLQRVWELAHFLNVHSQDEDLWLRWKSLYSLESRQLQIIPLALCSRWFACSLPAVISTELEQLPDRITLWLRYYGFSPLQALFYPNKNELWLNLALLSSFEEKLRVAIRRLFPLSGVVHRYSPAESKSGVGVLSRKLLSGPLQRLLFHAKTLPLACAEGLMWWARCRRIGD